MPKVALAFFSAALAAVTFRPPAGTPPPPTTVALAEFETSVNSGSAEYLEQAIRGAEAAGHEALIVRLDTPGGALEATRDIVKAELSSSVPVIVWVGPAGARAGSAGVFITVAAHVAAMAPTTNIGAAHPVTSTGEDVEKEGGKSMQEKVVNDTAAWAEGIAERRGRNAKWVATAVRESVSVTAEKALELHVVDLLAADLPELLRKVDGRTVELPGGPHVLRTAEARIMPVHMSLRQIIVDKMSNPNIAYLLLMLGMIGILAELYHPGTIFPGVVGGLLFILGLVATSALPVNYGAVVLLVAGVAMLAAELYVGLSGVLALGGLACLVLGSLLLIDKKNPGYLVDKGWGIGWDLVLPTVLIVGGSFALVAYKVVQSRRLKPVAGGMGLVGELGTAEEEVGPGGGRVFVHGEIWAASSEASIAPGTPVKVVGVEGLKLQVEAGAPRGAVQPKARS